MKGNVEVRKGRTGTRSFRARMSVDGRLVVGAWRASAKEAREDRDSLRKKARGIPLDAKIATLREAFAAVLREARRMRRRAATVKYYRERYRILSASFGRSFLVHNLTTDIVQQYVEKRLNGTLKDRKPVTRSTVHSDVIALGRATRLSVKRGWLRVDPVATAVIPKPDKPDPDWFSIDEVRGLLGQMRGTPPTDRLDPSRDADIVTFLALTGLRLKEAVQLTVRDVSIDRRVLVVREGKTGSRTVPLASPDLLAVAERLADNRHRFPRRAGERFLPLAYDGVSTMLRRWSDRVHEPRLHAHALRHSYGTALARSGASEQQIKTLMGHRTTYVANRYVHIAGADLAQVAARVTLGTAAPAAATAEQ